MYDPELIEVFVSRHVGAIYREDYDAEPYEDGYDDAPAEPPAASSGNGRHEAAPQPVPEAEPGGGGEDDIDIDLEDEDDAMTRQTIERS